MVCCPCVASTHYSELTHYCTHLIDGTFVQYLHCHLSFVRFAAWKVGSQKKLHVLVGKFSERFKLLMDLSGVRFWFYLRAVPGSHCIVVCPLSGTRNPYRFWHGYFLSDSDIWGGGITGALRRWVFLFQGGISRLGSSVGHSCMLSKSWLFYNAVGHNITTLPIRVSLYYPCIYYRVVRLGAGLTRKNSCSFGFCPNYPPPPPHRTSPQLGQVVQLFPTSKFKIWKSVED